MWEAGIKAAGARRYKATTDSNHNYPLAPNLLKEGFKMTQINQAWSSDITYIPTAQGWLYLCIVLDLFSRKIVGWSMKETLHAEIVSQALESAFLARKPKPGLIFHSDRSSQYSSKQVRRKLLVREVCQSMTGKGNCYDNSITETFFASLKKELVYRCKFKSRDEAKQKIFEYIEVFYNRERIHSGLDYMSPVEFEHVAACAAAA